MPKTKSKKDCFHILVPFIPQLNSNQEPFAHRFEASCKYCDHIEMVDSRERCPQCFSKMKRLLDKKTGWNHGCISCRLKQRD